MYLHKYASIMHKSYFKMLEVTQTTYLRSTYELFI